FIKSHINFKFLEKPIFRFIIFATLIIISFPTFKFFDHFFQKIFGLNRYLHFFDLIFFSFLAFCLYKKKRFQRYFSINLSLVILYIILMRLSILFSNGELHHRAFNDLFKTTFMILLFSIFLTKNFEKNQKMIIKCFLFVFFSIALFETIVGIEQFLLQRPLGFTFLKEPIFGHEFGSSAKILLPSKLNFLTQFIPSQKGELIRAHGTFIHPNIFAGFLNISTLLSLYQLYKAKKRFFFSLFLFLQMSALILTFSRAALAAFILSASIFFLLMVLKKYDVKKMGLVFLSLLIILTAFFSSFLIERGLVGNLFKSTRAKMLDISSNNTRNSLKKVSVNMIKKHPYFGVGYRNFLIKRDEYFIEKTQRAYVHNIYLLIASQTGLFSLFVFLLLLTKMFKDTFEFSLNPLTITCLCITISFLLIGFFDHYPISTHFGNMVFFACLGFL
nr:hypothetical protein [Candidatus Anoxychlamydiales bacterium]